MGQGRLPPALSLNQVPILDFGPWRLAPCEAPSFASPGALCRVDLKESTQGGGVLKSCCRDWGLLGFLLESPV